MNITSISAAKTSQFPLCQSLLQPSKQISFQSKPKQQRIEEEIDISDLDQEMRATHRKNTTIASLRNESGKVSVARTNVKGDIQTLSGDVYIADSSVSGSVLTNKGDISINKSIIDTDLKTLSGKIIIKDSQVKGTTLVPLDGLTLKGKNVLQKLILVNTTEGDGIVTVTKDKEISGSNSDIEVIKGEVLKTSKPFKSPEFILKSGNTINGNIKFISEKPGIVYVEEDAVFKGKVINGTIKNSFERKEEKQETLFNTVKGILIGTMKEEKKSE